MTKKSSNSVPSQPRKNFVPTVLLPGSVEEVRQSLPVILGIAKLLKDKDIGEFLGTPFIEHVRAQPRTVDLRIFWCSNKQPPLNKSRDGSRIIRANYVIPDVAKSKLDWAAIKRAAGGENGYTWGRFRATANLSNGRQMVVYGGTEREAIERLRELFLFTDDDITITTLSTTEEKKAGVREKDPFLFKETRIVYPIWCIISNTSKIVNESNREIEESFIDGKPVGTTRGKFRRKKTIKIPLWVNEKPVWFDSEVNEAFIDRGTGGLGNNAEGTRIVR